MLQHPIFGPGSDWRGTAIEIGLPLLRASVVGVEVITSWDSKYCILVTTNWAEDVIKVQSSS